MFVFTEDLFSFNYRTLDFIFCMNIDQSASLRVKQKCVFSELPIAQIVIQIKRI